MASRSSKPLSPAAQALSAAVAPVAATTSPLLVGVDFSSAPTRRKPIVLAFGAREGLLLRLGAFRACETLDAFSAWLQAPEPWLGGFDLPFGLPRELVEHLGWPTDWLPLMRLYASLDRAQIRATFKAFCDARPLGAKFAHRACDRPAASSPSMKWVNPPVAFMMHAGVPRMIDAGVVFPGLFQGQVPSGAQGSTHTALEAYPGLLAREILGARSYKNDAVAKQTPERLIARKDLVDALEQGRTRLGLRLKLSHAQRDALVADASGDRLDAVLCLMQVAWASVQPGYGLPADMDPLEGWILTA